MTRPGSKAERIWRQHHGLARWVARRFRPWDPEPVVSHVAEQICRYQATIDEPRAHHWISRVARNECARLDRLEKREQATLDAPINDDPALTIGTLRPVDARIHERVEARDLVDRVDARDRFAIVARESGMSYAEIGELTGWTPRMVSRNVKRGRAAVRAA